MNRDRLLILYIDIDDDLGRIGVETPILGEEAVTSAIALASKKIPRDSDFNTMVIAYNIYKDLKDKKKEVEIAFISGSEEASIEAHLQFSKKLDQVLSKVSPDGVIAVYDSPEDEKAIPIIQSRVKLVGIEKVIVEQSRGVEETYALFAKYVKKALTEPRFSRIFLGIPGFILVTFAIMSLVGLLSYTGIAAMLIIGIGLIIRGLNLDESFEKWWDNSPIMFISVVLAVVSFILGLVNLGLITSNVKITTASEDAGLLLTILPYFSLSLLILIVGKAISRILTKNVKIWHDFIQILTLVFSYYIVVSVLRQIENSNYSLGLQTIYLIVISASTLIFLYVIFTVVEKRRISQTKNVEPVEERKEMSSE